jgi:hypothetical protein
MGMQLAFPQHAGLSPPATELRPWGVERTSNSVPASAFAQALSMKVGGMAGIG